jgi:hypothetical protein
MYNIASASVPWMQSIGQTSTQALSFTPMHGSAMTYAIALFFSSG